MVLPPPLPQVSVPEQCAEFTRICQQLGHHRSRADAPAVTHRGRPVYDIRKTVTGLVEADPDHLDGCEC